MKRKNALFLLTGILFLVFSLHLFFSLQTEVIPYEAHFLFREVATIQENYMPFTSDPLSYQGRTHVFSLLFPYVATLLSLFLPNQGLLFLLQTIFSLGLVFLVFHTSYTLYSRYWISTLLAVLTATSTVVLYATRQTANPLQLFILLYLLVLLAFFKFPSKRASSLFAFFVVLATLTSPMVIIVVLGAIIYFIILYIENLQQRRSELEALAFSIVFIIWYHLLVYKKLLVTYGSQALWESIPRELISTIFQSLSLPVFIQLIGLVPLLLGLYGMYEGVFVKRQRSILFLVAMTVASAILLIFGLLPLIHGLAFTAINFILLSGFGIQRIVTFFNKTRFTWLKQAFVTILILISLLFFIPSLAQLQQPQGVQPAEAKFLSSLDLSGATILSTVQEGHAITYYTGQKNFHDTSFIFAPDPEIRYADAQRIYRSRSVSTILEITEHYGITHIYVSPLAKATYQQKTFFFETHECFTLIAKEEPYAMYKVTCSLNK